MNDIEKKIGLEFENIKWEIMDTVRNLPEDHKLSSDDSDLSDPWLCYCYYCQEEEGFYQSLYDDLIKGLCKSKVNNFTDIEVGVFLNIIEYEEVLEQEEIEDATSIESKRLLLAEALFKIIYNNACGEELPINAI